MHLSTKKIWNLACKGSSVPSALALRCQSTVAKAEEKLQESEKNQKSDVNTSKTVTTPPLPKPFLDGDLTTKTHKGIALKEALNELLRYPAGVDDDNYSWSDQWPTPRPFNPHIVPLPIRMGFAQNKCVVPDKYNNLELLKVQNFLHLTPPAIKKHCDMLKQFCTPFPSELQSDEACEKLFPVESHTVDYIAASNTVKDDRARTVTKTIRLCNLVINDHARRKMIQLLGKERYNRDTDIATIKSERCPTRKQNSDFINYVLTALYFESWAEEKWETRSQMNDYDCYYWWEDSNSHKNLKNIFKNEKDDELLNRPEVEEYRKAVSNIKLDPEPDNLGRMTDSRNVLLNDYKQAVLKLLNLQPLS